MYRQAVVSPKSLLHSTRHPAADMAHATELVAEDERVGGGADDEDEEDEDDDDDDSAD